MQSIEYEFIIRYNLTLKILLIYIIKVIKRVDIFNYKLSIIGQCKGTPKKILWGHGHTKFGRRIRSLQQFVVQQLPNEKVSELYETSVNF